MTQIRSIRTDAVAAPGGHYSQATAFGDLMFISGQLPIAADGTKLSSASFEEQARLVLENMLAIARAGGAGPENILKVTAYIVGIENWPTFNQVYARLFGEARPARAVVPVPALHYGFLIEVEAIAATAPGRGGQS